MSAKSTGGGWSQSGPLVTNNRMQAVTMQCNFAESPKGAQNYTIQFGITRPEGADVIIRPQAEISWNTEGNTVKRVVSVTDGMSVTGQAESCSVRLFDSIIDGNVPPAAAGIEYTGSIVVAPGNRPSLQQPPQLVTQEYLTALGVTISYFGDISVPAASFITQDIPVNAGVISAYVTAMRAATVLTAADVVVEQLGGATLGPLKLYFPIGENWVPISPGATQIRIRNNLAGSIRTSITYGIDG
jgi:hypothetical protein